MVLSQAQKQDAYREAKSILALGEKWQELMPGEKRPNFERAAQEIVRRALGHRVERNESSLDLHDGYMHQHDAREAHLVERYLKSGTVHPGALHSFVHGRERLGAPEKPPPAQDDLDDLPDFDLYVQNLDEDHHYPGHFVPSTGEFVSGQHEPPVAQEVKSAAEPGTRLPSAYEAVH